MGKKFVFYLKGGNRSITITDLNENRSLSVLHDEISKLMAGDRVCQFKTNTDAICLRPTEISGVHIQEARTERLQKDIDSAMNEQDESFFEDVSSFSEKPSFSSSKTKIDLPSSLIDVEEEEIDRLAEEDIIDTKKEETPKRQEDTTDLSQDLSDLLQESMEENSVDVPTEVKNEIAASIVPSKKESSTASIINKTVIHPQGGQPIAVGQTTGISPMLHETAMNATAAYGNIDKIPHVGNPNASAHIFQKDSIDSGRINIPSQSSEAVLGTIASKAKASGKVSKITPIVIPKGK